jgi:hypothetical protein
MVTVFFAWSWLKSSYICSTVVKPSDIFWACYLCIVKPSDIFWACYLCIVKPSDIFWACQK